jgi:hypothetical protein
MNKLDPFIVAKSVFSTSREQMHTFPNMRAGDPALATGTLCNGKYPREFPDGITGRRLLEHRYQHSSPIIEIIAHDPLDRLLPNLLCRHLDYHKFIAVLSIQSFPISETLRYTLFFNYTWPFLDHIVDTCIQYLLSRSKLNSPAQTFLEKCKCSRNVRPQLYKRVFFH